MEVIYTHCCGLDVHKKSISACFREMGPKGEVRKKFMRCGTMTKDILRLSDWMKSHGVSHVAMESTGVYWKPVWNILEGLFDVLLVNAKHIKQVPGRKTDMKDCEWIAQLLQFGLLPRSFVPPKPIRELRDLTRHRSKLAQQKGSVVNRIQKVLEDANIKLSSVATDIMGVSGREMLEALIAGQDDPGVMAELAKRRLRSKIPELTLALEGKVTSHHRFLLRLLIRQLDDLESYIEELNSMIEEKMRPFDEALRLLVTIPGVDLTTAECLIAEVGIDMDQFPSSAHLASWAGICPGNDESAGKRKSGKTPKGNRWLRRVLGESSWAASRTKNTYLSAQYNRILMRRGKKRAIVAVGHSILVSYYYIIKEKKAYQDLGSDYFTRLNPESHKRYHVKKLESLGYEVILTKAA
jgi:transposase